MKKWTVEDLYEFWLCNGYSKKRARKIAEKEYAEMNKPKTAEEIHEIMQKMTYN